MTKRIFRRSVYVAASIIAIPLWLIYGAYTGLGMYAERFKELWEDA